jgi:phage RecT family recombinase
LQSFQLNLFPGVSQECAYVPLNNRRTGKVEANFWLQYQGLVKLLRNAGNKVIIARVVFEGDHFEYNEGAHAPVYAPAVVLGKKRGKPLFAYAAVCTAQDMWQVEVMSPEQINVIKGRSMGARMPDSPWNSPHEDDVFAMWAKTVLKRVSKGELVI